MNWKAAKFLLFVIVLALGVVNSAPLRAQVTGATLLGTITDQSGGGIANAKITVRDPATGVTTDTTTNTDGAYTVPNLNPADYEVSISAPGFSTAVSKVTLTVGARQQLSLALTVGQVAQTIEVTGAAPQVQLSSSSLGAEVTATTVRELPLNGRDWTQLATLQPGVAAAKSQVGTNTGQGRVNRGWGNQLIAAGHRSVENNYRMDGISINDYTNSSPGSVLGSNPGVDAIQEFSVITSNYSSEYGRTSGAVINAITRSGTNQFHGSAFEFLRNNKLDARNFFDPSTGGAPGFQRNQFGGAAGGPIRKNKTFIFGAYEGVRQNVSLNFNKTVVPSAALLSGTLGSLTASPTTVTVSPNIQPYLNAGFWGVGPFQVIPGNNGDERWFSSPASQHTPDNFLSMRADHTISDKDNLAGSYFYDHSVLTQPNLVLTAITGMLSTRHMAGIQENHVFSSTLTNTARFGYNRTVGWNTYPVQAINPNVNDPSFGVIAGRNAPGLTVTGSPFVACCNSFSLPGQITTTYNNSFQGYDDVFLTKGTHSLTFGFAVERIQENAFGAGAGAGSLVFPTVTALLQDAPSSATGPFLSGTGNEVAARQTFYGLYAQDDWRVRPYLTLNLGLRWEPESKDSDANNRFYNILNPQNGDTPTLVQSYTGDKNNSLKDFAPRVGFAWDPFHDGKTAVRGGFGMFDVLKLPWQYVHNLEVAYPYTFNSTITTTASPGVPAVIDPDPVTNPQGVPLATNVSLARTVNQAGKASTMSIQPNAPINYAMNWNLNIQHQFTSTLTATIGYVGSSSVHQSMLSSDGNEKLPIGLTSAGYLWPCSGSDPAAGPLHGQCQTGAGNNGVGTYFDPNVTGGMAYLIWNGKANYHSLQASVIKQMSHGFQVQGSYTYSKCIDLNDAGYTSDPYNTDISDPRYYQPKAARGPCSFDLPQSFVANFIWQLPTPKFGGAIGDHVLGGWQLGGVFSASHGSPTTPLILGDSLGTVAVNEAKANNYNFPDFVSGPGCNNPVTGNPNAYFNMACFSDPTVPAGFTGGACRPGLTGTTPQTIIPNTCMNLLGNEGRDHVYGPDLINFDFSIFKSIPIRKISEVSALQFRAEMYNIFNRANFNPPGWIDMSEGIFNTDGSPATSHNTITSTTTTSRQIQFGLKLSW